MGLGGRSPILQRKPPKLKKGFKMLELTNAIVKIGNLVSYYKYHQSTKPRRKLPRRKMLDITKSMTTNIMKDFREFFITDTLMK